MLILKSLNSIPLETVRIDKQYGIPIRLANYISIAGNHIEINTPFGEKKRTQLGSLLSYAEYELYFNIWVPTEVKTSSSCVKPIALEAMEMNTAYPNDFFSALNEDTTVYSEAGCWYFESPWKKGTLLGIPGEDLWIRSCQNGKTVYGILKKNEFCHYTVCGSQENLLLYIGG